MADLFVDPRSNDTEDGLDAPGAEIPGAMGSPQDDALNSARARRKKMTVLLAGGGVAALAVVSIVMLRAGSLGKRGDVAVADSSVSIEKPSIAKRPEESAMSEKDLEQLAGVAGTALKDTGTVANGSTTGLVGPNSGADPLSPDFNAANAGSGSRPGSATTDDPLLNGTGVLIDPSLQTGDLTTTGGTNSANPAGKNSSNNFDELLSAASAARQGESANTAASGREGTKLATTPEERAVLEAERRREAAAARQAMEEAKAEALDREEKRLNNSGLKVAGAESGDDAPSTVRRSRYGTGVAPTAAEATPGSAAAGTSGAGGLFGSRNDLELTPGTKVDAVLTSKFISDMSGGTVEAQLLSPLRDRRGRVLVPAGSKAFGTGAGSVVNGSPMVAVTFNTYVTPRGDIIRDGPVGTGGDPKTYARGVKGTMDRRLFSKAARGLAASAVEVFVSQGATSRPSGFEMPSPRDRAIMSIQDRSSRILEGESVDESSAPSTVVLEKGTRFVMIYGLR